MPPSDMQPYELMQRMADFLERESVRYRVVGSMASMAYGEARFTNDVDILADLTLDKVEALCREFPAPDYYVSPQAIREAIIHRHQFNILHPASGLKMDVFVLQDSEFARTNITHGRRLKSEGLYDAWFALPENVILKKLEYFKEGGSEKHLRDIAGVLLVQADAIDRTYIDEWAGKLGVATEWKMVCERLREKTG